MPALALTLLVAGTVAASAFTNGKTKAIDETYWGLPQGQGGTRIELPGPPPTTDCDESLNSCYVKVNEEGEEFFPGGLYDPQ